MWCLNAELRGFDREATVLAPQAHALALKLGFKNPCVQRLLQQMAKEQYKLHQDGWLDNVESREFGRVQQEITNALGGLERITFSAARPPWWGNVEPGGRRPPEDRS